MNTADQISDLDPIFKAATGLTLWNCGDVWPDLYIYMIVTRTMFWVDLEDADLAQGHSMIKSGKFKGSYSWYVLKFVMHLFVSQNISWSLLFPVTDQMKESTDKIMKSIQSREEQVSLVEKLQHQLHEVGFKTTKSCLLKIAAV